MTTANNYGKNEIDDYIANMILTSLFIFLITKITNQSNVWEWNTIFVILIVVFFSYAILIKPGIKIQKGIATHQDMANISLFPIIGLLRMYWPPYQRMIEKIENEKVIKICENTLKEMKNIYSHGFGSFEKNWAIFKKWFPVIKASDETHKKRRMLIKIILSTAIKHEETELQRTHSKIKTDGVAIFMLTKATLKNSIWKEVKTVVIHAPHNTDQEVFDEMLKTRTIEFTKLQEKLLSNEKSLTQIFDDLSLVIKEHYQSYGLL